MTSHNQKYFDVT